ncbi:MAG: hypothetical protein WC866_00455 [Patescibacteria group bacterium]|jgi:hypothetical protein
MPYQLSVLLVIFLACSGPNSTGLSTTTSEHGESIVQCLTRKEVRLYGASWCNFCQEQLLLFGDDVAGLPYTDCDPKGELDFRETCTEQGVPYGTIIPVWIFKDGSRLYGVRHPDVIAVVADCP